MTSTARQRFLVFGATGGIGSELVRRLLAGGAQVAVTGRDPDRLDALAGETGALRVRAADCGISAEAEGAVGEAVEALGGLDGVAHCVGSMLLKPAHLTTDAEWDGVMHTNLTSAFHVLRAVVRRASQPGLSLVFCSSVAAQVGLSNHEAIAAAKAGVGGLVLSAAATYASRGIRVNAVAPGLVRTPMTERITSSESAMKASVAMHPLGRIGEPGDVAAAIAWLLGPESGWVTGQVIGIDGGLANLRARASV